MPRGALTKKYDEANAAPRAPQQAKSRITFTDRAASIPAPAYTKPAATNTVRGMSAFSFVDHHTPNVPMLSNANTMAN